MRLLKQRIAEAASGKLTWPRVERTTFEDLAAMLVNDYRANGLRSLARIEDALEHLRRFFGNDRAITITSDRITSYKAFRQEEQAANATINRELSALKRAFKLAAIAGKVAQTPHIRMLEEDNVRQGFVTNVEFEWLRESLPADLRDPVEFLYRSGWRVNEMRSLQWRDIKAGVIRLRSENSKNKKGRALPLRREFADIIERAMARRLPELPFVFRRDDGSPIGLFRKSWATACKQAGLGALLVHDLRRSAIKNMIDAGLPEQIAMAISGHKTRSTFARYAIVTEEAVARALEDVSDHLASQPRTAAIVVPFRRPS